MTVQCCTGTTCQTQSLFRCQILGIRKNNALTNLTRCALFFFFLFILPLSLAWLDVTNVRDWNLGLLYISQNSAIVEQRESLRHSPSFPLICTQSMRGEQLFLNESCKQRERERCKKVRCGWILTRRPTNSDQIKKKKKKLWAGCEERKPDKEKHVKARWRRSLATTRSPSLLFTWKEK